MSQNMLETRSYFLWFFLGIITLGICLIIYNYLNFSDLDEHYKRIGQKEKAPSTDTPILLLVILCVLLPGIGQLVSFYYKYSKLHDHIAAYQGAPNIPDGLQIILLTTCLSWLTLGILSIYYEWKWQDVFNQHNRWHNLNTSQISTR